MLQDWLFIGLLLPIAVLLPAVAIGLNWLLGPKKSNLLKRSTYECGIETVGEAWVQFRAQYYIFALVFVIFDVEAVFLYPWAVAFRQVEIYGFVEVVVFVIILAIGLLYAWRKNALEWK